MSKKHVWLIAAAVLAAAVLVIAAYAVFIGGGEAKVIPMAEALARIQGGEKVVILDVRTPEELADGKLPGSVMLTLDVTGGFASKVQGLIPDKSATVFVYCRSGRRSQSAAEIMAGLGYSNVHNIGGVNDVPENMLER